jgi:hypothetical protein
MKKAGSNTVMLVILLVGFVALAYWAMISFTARDPLWFAKGFEGQPSQFIVYQAGQQTVIRPGQAGFDELATALQTSLAQGFSRQSNVGYSEHSLQEARERYLTLEAHFDRPITMHAWFRMGRTTQMLFPITGPHSDQPLVLLGDQGHYRAGAPVLQTLEPILEALSSLGFN